MNQTRASSGHTLSSSKQLASSILRFGALPIVLIVCVVVFQLGNDRFLSSMNVMNMTTQSMFLLLIALGQMIVLISGGFDLSVGAVVALTSIITGKVMVAVAAMYPESVGIAITLGFMAAIGVGLVCGLINGIGVAILKVNPFIVTLATASIFQGITLVVSKGVQVSGLPRYFVIEIGSGRIGNVPVIAILALPVCFCVYLIIHHMRVGRYLYAIGSNLKSAVVSGIRVDRHLIFAYVSCSVLTAFAGWLLTARVSSGEPLLGGEFPLASIAAAIIGGCSLRGGEGTVIGVIMGVAFITILGNGMDLMRIGSNYQMIVLGIVLIAAVVVDRYRASLGVR